MLEIILIAQLARHLAKRAQDKGHSPGWAAVGVLGWIGGEILGVVIGFLLDMEAGAYLLGLLGAAAGALAGFVAVQMLPDRREPGLAIDDVERTFR